MKGGDDTLPSRPALERLRANLKGLAEAYEESERAMGSAGPVLLRERVSGSRAAVGIVLDEKLMALRSEMTEVLASWAGLVVTECAAPGRSRPRVEREVGSLVRFLDRHLEWLAAHLAAAEFEEEVALLLESSARMFGPPVRRLPVGDYPRPGCASTLHAVLRKADDHESPPSHVACESGHLLPPRQWLLIAGRLRQCASAAGSAADRRPGGTDR